MRRMRQRPQAPLLLPHREATLEGATGSRWADQKAAPLASVPEERQVQAGSQAGKDPVATAAMAGGLAPREAEARVVGDRRQRAEALRTGDPNRMAKCPHRRLLR